MTAAAAATLIVVITDVKAQPRHYVIVTESTGPHKNIHALPTTVSNDID